MSEKIEILSGKCQGILFSLVCGNPEMPSGVRSTGYEYNGSREKFVNPEFMLTLHTTRCSSYPVEL